MSSAREFFNTLGYLRDHFRLSEGFLPSVYVAVARGYQQVRLDVAQPGGQRQTIAVLSHREPENFIYPYLSKRKVAGYNQNVSENFTRDVLDNLETLVAKVDRLINIYYPEHDEYERACIDILGFPITTFQAGAVKQAGIIVDSYNNIPIEAMGEGVPNILGLIVNLCMAKNKLFLIEELENDIHPQALKSLLELIMRKADDNQFVISTHSNIVAKYLGSIPDSKIHEVTLAPYSPSNRIPTSIYKEVGDTPEERREVLEKLGYEMTDYDLWKGWLILEESSAERIINDFLIPQFTPSLLGKLRTVAGKGIDTVEVKFEDFNRLFLFTHLAPAYKNKAWVVVDNGTRGNEIIEELKEKYMPGGWKEEQFRLFSKEDFEEYYPEDFQDEVTRILQKPDGQHKQAAKRELLYNVLAYIKEDEQRAREAFARSADEVITLLQIIEKVLCPS